MVNSVLLKTDEEQSKFDFDTEGKLEKQFWAFHLKHGEVYEEIVSLARKWREKKGPESKLGISALYERARWEIHFNSLDGKNPPKLSNNHKPFYARLIMENNDDLKGLFKLKRQKVQATFGPQNEALEPDDLDIW
tara:strand:+ start:27 stop:431 length:405 start_codon:yes stop_codon:yes gene_type:complete